MKNIMTLLLGSLIIIAQVRACEYNSIQTDNSTLIFVYSLMGMPVEGRLKKFDAQLRFDPVEPETANLVLDLDISSLDAGSLVANEEIASQAWLNKLVFPRAKFVSSGFKFLGGNRYEVSGNISIKSHTQAISVPFTLNKHDNIAFLEGGFVLKRADFDIGEGIWADFGIIDNEIRLQFQFPVTAKI